MKMNIHFWSYPTQFFVEWKMFQTQVVEEIQIHILCSITFFICTIYEILWKKYCTAGQTADDDMAHELRMLYTWGYSLALRICNTYCFPTATVETTNVLHCSVTHKVPVLCAFNLRTSSLTGLGLSQNKELVWYLLKQLHAAFMKEHAFVLIPGFTTLHILWASGALSWYSILPFCSTIIGLQTIYVCRIIF
jgi:hypothetical protein